MRNTATSRPSVPTSISTADRPWRRTAVVLVLFAAVFGAADQYLGSLVSWHPWTVDASLLAAPWLALPFVAGWTQHTARRAAALATICTFVALLGFIAMTLSPVEQAEVSLVGLVELLRWQVRWFLLAGITSPPFGWLGFRWRVTRTVWAPTVVAAAFCVEPLVRAGVGRPTRSPLVWGCEVGAGVALFAVGLVVSRRRTPGPATVATGPPTVSKGVEP